MPEDPPKLRALPKRNDPMAELIAGVEEHLEMVPQFVRVLAAEFNGLREEGVDAIAAAVLIGQRFKMSS